MNLSFGQTVHPLQPLALITSLRDSPYCKGHKKMTCRLPIPGQNNLYGIYSFWGQTGRGSMVMVVSGKNVPPPGTVSLDMDYALCIMHYAFVIAGKVCFHSRRSLIETKGFFAWKQGFPKMIVQSCISAGKKMNFQDQMNPKITLSWCRMTSPPKCSMFMLIQRKLSIILKLHYVTSPEYMDDDCL